MKRRKIYAVLDYFGDACLSYFETQELAEAYLAETELKEGFYYIQEMIEVIPIDSSFA